MSWNIWGDEIHWDFNHKVQVLKDGTLKCLPTCKRDDCEEAMAQWNRKPNDPA